MAATYNFPFTIEEVATVMNLTIRSSGSNNPSIDVDCPFCSQSNGRKGKMNLKKATDQFRCNYCGESGGMLRLYAQAYGISSSAAYQEIYDLLGCNSKKDAPYKNTKTTKTASTEIIRADTETIHQTYSAMLAQLTLSNPNWDQLLARGLTHSDINKYGYKSVPAFGQQGLCDKLIKSGCHLDGVPGFYKKDRRWNVKLNAPGIVIPVCGVDGKIAAIQIRLRTPFKDKKYIWLSSNGLEGGASSGSPLHFIGDPTAKKVFITEGALKGTIAHCLTGHTFICLPGVNNIGHLPSLLNMLKANGTALVIEAFDIDKKTNIQVGQAALKLRELIKSLGLAVKSADWKDASLKGVDDYYFKRWHDKQKMVYAIDSKPMSSSAYTASAY